MGDYRLDWKGDDVKRQVLENAAAAMAEFGLTVEAESKKELRKGHGVLTGTLRRSIHTALPGYDWGGDDVEPKGKTRDSSGKFVAGSPERGGQLVIPDTDNVTVQVGSGLQYAMPVHQGHHSFQGYHFITNGLNKAKGKLQSILARHKVQQ